MCLYSHYLNNEVFLLPHCVTVFILPQECVCAYYPSCVTMYYFSNVLLFITPLT